MATSIPEIIIGSGGFLGASGVFTGLVIAQRNRRQDRADAKRKAADDRAALENDQAYKRAQEQATEYFKQIQQLQHDLDETRDERDEFKEQLARCQTDFQNSIRDRDEIVGKNHLLQAQLDNANTELNKRNL